MRLLIVYFSIGSLFACDVCNMVEYSNRENKHYTGFFFRFRGFNGYSHLENNHSFTKTLRNNARTDHEPVGMLVDKNEKDWERYFTMEGRVNFTIKEKWNVLLLMPYQINQVFYSRVFVPFRPVKDSLIHLSGVGDLVVAGDRLFTLEAKDYTLYLKPGLAVKLPTGKHDTQMNQQLLDPVLQLGTSSFDFITRLNAIFTDELKGIECSVNYRLNTKGKNNYRFGNRTNLQTHLFYNVPLGSTSRWVPKAGVYWEKAELDAFQGQSINYSGGQSVFLNVGNDWLIKQIAVQLLYQRPVYERLNGPVIGNAGRIVAGVVYNF